MSAARCALCRGLFPAAQLVVVDQRAICAGCKPVLLQRVLSGAREPLDPLGFDGGELEFWAMLELAWTVFRRAWPRLLPLVVGISLLCSQLDSLFGESNPETGRELLRSVGTTTAGDLIFGIIATLGVTWLAQEEVEGRPGSLPAALAHARRRWLAALATGWLEFAILLVSLLLLILPAVILSGYFIFSAIIVSLRGLAGPAALRHSRALVTGRWWRVMGYALALYLPMLGTIFCSLFVGAMRPAWACPQWVENLLLDLAALPALLGLTVLFLHLDARHRARLEVDGELPQL